MPLYRAKIDVAAELGRPAQKFTIKVKTANLTMAERLAHQWVMDRSWHAQPSDIAVTVQLEEIEEELQA